MSCFGPVRVFRTGQTLARRAFMDFSPLAAGEDPLGLKPNVLLHGHMRLLDHVFTSLAFACKACDRARADSRGQNGAGMRPPPYCRQGSCCLSAQQPRYAGQLLGRTYAQRAGDRMLAPSRLLQRTLRTAPLEVVVRISPTWGCVPDRYRADTARSAQGRRCSPIVRSSSRKGRNSLCGVRSAVCWNCRIPRAQCSVYH